MKSFYLTTPIYYVNDAPHIGHAYTTVAGDVLTRWHRQRGESVWFLTGTDEHGQKVMRTAEQNNVAPQAWVDKLVAEAWKPNWTALNQEGCGEVDGITLLETWARHSLLWLNGLDDPAGRSALYREWKGLVWNLGKETSVALPGETLRGMFLGVDQNFGMILKTGDDTRLLPLTRILERN